ncbi:CMRF35-like molecule 6 isoform X3 [Nerophis ophidion]|nr:CMRF35-like molecule 6 isoform X3 [Nerophis ophidion]XP_061747411.1 CMRF35-like molecule 6 isoform X3 [Nerophis ophidion]XP_061747412.1 CMRF35-like molecule 6 isoform X3 [Nerophis ophidion]XP_061747413.1 CMRF35-like molecule 6 isoform X3 [Nerophis ophidion]
MVPCHYDPQYASSVKYWCRGKAREFCTSLARTDQTPAGGKVSIFDDPIQQVFTVTVENMKEEDSGWYMCGVEIGGFWKADAVAFTNVKVIPGMSVVNNQLRGEEGTSVTAECQYSERHRDSEKKWCRSGDPSSCSLTGPGGSYQGPRLALDDDKTGTLTVTIKSLQMSDMGWYWCSAGELSMAVHVQVTPRTSSTAVSATSQAAESRPVAMAPQPKPTTKDSWRHHALTLEAMAMWAAFMLALVLAIVARRLQRQGRFVKLRRTVGRNAQSKENTRDAADLQVL